MKLVQNRQLNCLTCFNRNISQYNITGFHLKMYLGGFFQCLFLRLHLFIYNYPSHYQSRFPYEKFFLIKGKIDVTYVYKCYALLL